MPNLPWHFITGEYPPHPGGVADYAQLLAQGLARAGEIVHVWTGGNEGSAIDEFGVEVHQVAGGFHRDGLARLDNALDGMPSPRRLYVQYVPQAYGRRGMNVGFCRWVRRRSRRGDEVWTMFHEVLVEFLLRDPPKIWVLSAVTRWMAGVVLKASSRSFASIPDWERVLRTIQPDAMIRWLSIPSSIPVTHDPAAVRAIRQKISPDDGLILGSFATFTSWMRQHHRQTLITLLETRPNLSVLLLGRNSHEFAAELIASHPSLDGRIVGPGLLDAVAMSLHLQACDVMLQPYPDGISSRRTTVMSDLIHGRPIVTTSGHLTEEIWSETGAVRIAPVGDPAEFRRLTEELLDDPGLREEISLKAKTLYAERFSLERTIETLFAAAKESDQLRSSR